MSGIRIGRLGRAAAAAARDRGGVAMVEFALLAPIFIALFIGTYEAASLVLADMKLESGAETAADLIAQTKVNTVLQASDFSNLSNAVTQVLTPLSTSGTALKIAFASVTFNTGAAAIDWHYEYNGATALTVNTLPNGASAANLGSQTNGSTDSFVVAQLTYTYTSPITYVFNTSYTLTEGAMNRPRYQNCVATYLNTNNTCP